MSQPEDTLNASCLVDQKGAFVMAVVKAAPWDINSAIVRDLAYNAEAFTQALRKVLDPIGKCFVCIDDSKPVVYPKWVKRRVYPDLPTRPPLFSMESLKQYLHDDQKECVVEGYVLHEYFRDNDMIQNCFGLAELLAIKKLGIETFRKHFAGKKVFGWYDAVQHYSEGCFVPYLFERYGKVCLSWRHLSNDWYTSMPALRYGE